MAIYLRTLRYFRAYSGHTILAVLLMSAGIGFNLLAPWPFKYVVDGILQPKNAAGVSSAHAFISEWFSWTNDRGAALTLFVIMALIAVVSGLVNLLSNTLLIKIGLKALLHIRTQLYS